MIYIIIPFHSTVDSAVHRALAVQPNQSYQTTPSRFSTNQSHAQLRRDGPVGNLQELTPEYAKLDPEYAAIYTRKR